MIGIKTSMVFRCAEPAQDQNDVSETDTYLREFPQFSAHKKKDFDQSPIQILTNSFDIAQKSL